MNEQIKIPEGTVTFLFTDIEGSTQLLDRLRDQYATLLADQRRILRGAFAKWNGSEIDTQGDAFFVAFPRATDAVSAAVDIQHALATHTWSQEVEVRVRMGLHTGEPLTVEEGYVGMDVHRAARIAHVGHGGQVLLSETTAALVRDELPEGVSLLDLGRHRLKDLSQPEHIRQLVIQGMPSEFPPLTSLEVLPPELSSQLRAVGLPAFLEGGVNEAEEASPLFVARERELERLEGYLKSALNGEGKVVFVTGGPGRGKTALIEAFSRQAERVHHDLLVGSGRCNARTGMGDPYLPFRETLAMLTADVESRWAAGGISLEQSRRLWENCPFTAQTLVDEGPDLVGVFIPAAGLHSRICAAVPENRTLQQSLRSLVEKERSTPDRLEQVALFEQYTSVLAEIAGRHPLLVMLDDLQWADTASINLLFHLGRHLAGRRILVVGAYRSEEITLGREGGRHPLESVLNEFKRSYGDTTIDLSNDPEGEAKQFVGAILDSEPNLLGEGFREALFEHTDGHPLFTVELLRDLQERGDLVQVENSGWVEGPSLDWSVLPARVEGVIEERIGRLQQDLRESLTVASVEGEDFTAQVVAGVRNEDTRQLVHQLSGELDKKHRLVAERGTTQVADQPLYLYHFRHNLFQQHIYNGLGEIERKMLHKDVGEVLEVLYGDETARISSQLAMHFSRAGEEGKAIPYLLLAGDQARDLYSHQEAITYYQQALGYLKHQGNYDLAARTLMKLGLTYHTAFEFQQSQVAYKEGFALWKRAAELKHTILPPVSRALKVYFEMGIPETIDPSRCGDSNSADIIDQLFRGLVEITPENDVVPGIARTWEVLDDGRKYRFYLRDDVYWSDGVRVTAGDFEYGWKRALEQDSPVIIASNFYDIKGACAFHRGEVTDTKALGVRALDEMTLEIELESPAGYFLYLLVYSPPFFPVPRHVVEKHGEEWTQVDRIVTNGPFVLGSWEPGKPVVLTRNPKYYGEYQGNVENVEVIISEAQPGLSPIKLYEDDKIDILTLGTNTFHYRQLFPGEYFSRLGHSVYFIGFNVQRALFFDPRVRKAFVMATDRENLANVVLGGLHYPATGGLVPPMIPGHTPGIALPYDPDEARHLLAQAGYPGGEGFPMVDFLAPWRRKDEAQYLQDQWLDVLGVGIDLRILAGSTYWEAKDNYNYHVVFGGWEADYPDPDNFLRISMQNLNWVDEEYTHLLEEACQSNDQRQRIELYQQAERILIEQIPIMPVYYDLRHYLVKPWIRFSREFVFLYFKDVIQEPHQKS